MTITESWCSFNLCTDSALLPSLDVHVHTSDMDSSPHTEYNDLLTSVKSSDLGSCGLGLVLAMRGSYVNKLSSMSSCQDLMLISEHHIFQNFMSSTLSLVS